MAIMENTSSLLSGDMELRHFLVTRVLLCESRALCLPAGTASSLSIENLCNRTH